MFAGYFDSLQEISAIAAESELNKNENYTVTVTGMVFSDGQPVRGADIFLCIPEKLTPSNPEAEKVASTNSDGTFAFSYSIAKKRLRLDFLYLITKKNGYAIKFTALDTYFSQLNINIELEHSEPVTGIVHDENGSAIAGATVTPVFSYIHKDYDYENYTNLLIPGMETVTRADGSFELRDLPVKMAVNLKFVSDGFGQKLIGPVHSGQRDFPVTLVPEGRITGKVINTVLEKLAGGVIVHASPKMILAGEARKLFSAVTDKNGSFVITNITPGMYDLYIDTYWEERSGRFAFRVNDIEIRSGETTTIPDIILVKGVNLSGRISIRETGEPLSSVKVQAYVREERRYSTITDDDGKYEIMCLPGSGFITTSMTEYHDVGREPNRREFDTADRDTVRGLDFTFEKGKKVTIRVLSPEGEIVPYALPYLFPPSGVSGEIVQYFSSKREQLTLSAEREDLHLRGRGPSTEISDGLVYDIPTERYETTSASGSVTDSEGKPVSLASVIIRSQEKRAGYSPWRNKYIGLTDGNGNFIIHDVIIKDDNIVIIEKNGHINGEKTLKELALGTNNIGDIVLESAEGWLAGIVTDKHKNPIQGANIFINNRTSERSSSQRSRTVTNAEGQYRLEGLLPMMQWMQVSQSNYRDYYERNIVTNMTKNIILLGHVRYLEGTVKDEQGNPIIGAALYSSIHEPMSQKNTKTDQNGYYKLEDLQGVTETISIIHPDFGQSHYSFILTNGTWNFTLIKPKGFLAGTVVSPDKTPLNDASIRFRFNDYPNSPEQFSYWTFYEDRIPRTDENGQFRIENILEGRFEMEIYHQDYGYTELTDVQLNRDDAILVMEKRPESRMNKAIIPKIIAPREGSFAPEFKVSRWINSEPLLLENLHGDIVIIHFWSVDDPSSCNATRLMQALQKEYEVSVIGIHASTEDSEAVREFIERKGISYPIAVDTLSRIKGGMGETFNRYGISRFRYNILIDRNGKIKLNNNVYQTEQKLLDIIANESI
ncbi:carboxypeptidase regulatory-like domain-containing protein [Candidatus Latescibacterota bacterium]